MPNTHGKGFYMGRTVKKHECENKQRYHRLIGIYPTIEAALPFALYLDLVRKAKILHSWYESECNGTRQQDEATGQWYWHNPDTGNRQGEAIDLEMSAQKNIKKICDDAGLFYFLHTDPRGGTLYISKTLLNQENYNKGFFVA